MFSSSLQPVNWSLYSIPTVYALGLLPQAYALLKMTASSGGQWTNVQPRQNFDALKGKVPQEVWNRCFRARGAHINALESFPLFAAAMIAGNVVKLPAQELNTIAAEYIGARVLYTLLYIGVRSEPLSFVRTGVWYWSIGIPMWSLYKAGKALNNVDRVAV
ncbi:MAG: hypothetical protein M1833_001109 [Piccolia ochrophora]|nr:MAG: hypothetical protein M1833_001109 [Piccolia ochrophora]